MSISVLENGMREVIGCENFGVELKCDDADDVIKIINAIFGRTEDTLER